MRQPEAVTAEDVAGLIRGRVREAFQLAEDKHARDPYAMSASRVGGCTREAAYRLAGTPPTDPGNQGLRRQAWLGTWLHRGFMPMLRLRLGRARTEVPITLRTGGIELPGRFDLWARRRSSGDIVIDGKTVAPYGLEWVRRDGMRDKDRLQLRTYAAGLVQAGATVRWIVAVYFDRASGDDEVIVEPFGPREYAETMERITQLIDMARDPDTAPRDERGPGLSVICDGCPWLRRCWGEAARPGEAGPAQARTLGGTADGIREALELYDAARKRESDAKKDKDFARAILSEGRPDVYGDLQLGWGSPGREKEDELALYKEAWSLTHSGLDPRDLLAIEGVPVPMKPGSRPAIQVTRKGQG
jgi:hypothetical protein